MATTVQNVIIEFTTDTSDLATAEDRLEQLGTIDKSTASSFKNTNVELNKRVQLEKQVAEALAKEQTITNKLVASLKTLSGESKRGVESLLKLSGKELAAGFEQAAISVEDYITVLQLGESEAADFESTTESLTEANVGLKTRLRELTQELGKLKLAGEDNTEQYQEMVREAGNIKDAMADASAEIKNAGSDTRTFDNLLGAAQAVAGGFAVAQGAAALFGDESEELQETLLKVNAAMSIAQGLQSITNALQKEGAITMLAQTVATKAQTGAQVAFNFVVGTSTGLLKAFRIALAATGVGLLIVGLIALVEALSDTEENLESVNNELERQKELTEAVTSNIERLTEIEIARADAAGKAESDLTRIRGRSLQAQAKAFEETNKQLVAQRDALNPTSQSWFLLNKAIQENNDEISNLNQKAVLESLQLEKQLADERKKNAEEEKRKREEAEKKAREARIQELSDQLALQERKKLAAEIAGTETLEFEKKIIQLRAKIELEGENLTKHQKALIREQAANEENELIKKRIKEQSSLAIQGQIAINNAALSQIEIGNEDRRRLQEENIILQAQLEADAAEGNAQKIKEINAKRDADIKAVRLKFIEDTLAYELELEAANSAAIRRQQEREAANPRLALAVRFKAIDDLTNYELKAIDKRINALNSEYAAGLISLRDYNLKYAKLQDDQAKAVEDAEEKKREAQKQTAEQKAAEDKKLAQDIINNTGQAVSVLSAFYNLQKQQDENKLDSQRKVVAQLLETGAITEKEAAERNKRIDQEEKKIRRQQAQRDKQIAIFQAVVNTAAAVAQALPNFVLAGIAGALGAAQIAIIASTPIPQFRKGKKDRYEGLGEVGEAGAELIEHNGRMYIADKPQIIWLGKETKVYTPQETQQMLNYNTAPLNPVYNYSSEIKIDYDRIGKSVASNIPQFGLSINEDGFKEWMREKESFIVYLNNRRGYGN